MIVIEISYNLKNMALKKYQPTSAMGLECPNVLIRYVQISDENLMFSTIKWFVTDIAPILFARSISS